MSYPCFRGHKAEVYKLGIDVLMCDEVRQRWLSAFATNMLVDLEQNAVGLYRAACAVSPPAWEPLCPLGQSHAANS